MRHPATMGYPLCVIECTNSGILLQDSFISLVLSDLETVKSGPFQAMKSQGPKWATICQCIIMVYAPEYPRVHIGLAPLKTPITQDYGSHSRIFRETPLNHLRTFQFFFLPVHHQWHLRSCFAYGLVRCGTDSESLNWSALHRPASRLVV